MSPGFQEWMEISTAHISAPPRGSLIWSASCGPVAVVRLSLERIGWSILSASKWATNKVCIVDLDEYGPREVKSLVERAAQDWTWAQASKHRAAYAELSTTPLLAPIRQVLASKSRPCWSQAAKGWLRVACADAWDDSIKTCDICQGAMSVWHSC